MQSSISINMSMTTMTTTKANITPNFSSYDWKTLLSGFKYNIHDQPSDQEKRKIIDKLVSIKFRKIKTGMRMKLNVSIDLTDREVINLFSDKKLLRNKVSELMGLMTSKLSGIKLLVTTIFK